MNNKSNSLQRANDSRVSIVNDRGKIRFLVNTPYGRKSLSLGLDYAPKNLKLATKIADQIDADILFGKFNGDLKAYKPGYVPKLEIVPDQAKINEIKPKNATNLKDCWELYKKHKKGSICESVQKNYWPERDRVISLLESESLLSLDQASEALEFLLKRYAYGSLDRTFKDFCAATNLAIDLGKYEGKNYYSSVLKTFPKAKKKEIQAFTKEDIKTILEALRNNKYCSEKSGYKHSYYANLVEFRFLTGCRPSEAIALTWDDIKDNSGTQWIVFSKAYVNGCLQDHTKTKEDRCFQVYPQLKALIDNLPRIPNEHNLIFPSIRDKGYIPYTRFNDSVWRPVVRDGLFKNGEISKYLPFYDERHTFITNAIQIGLDPATIARIAGRFHSQG